MKQDYIILIHKYGYENAGKLLKIHDILMFLEDNGIDTDDSDMRSSIEHVIRESFTTGYIGPQGIYIFKNEAYYRYLEYLGLLEARKDSKNARVWSIVALVMSVVIGIIQILKSN